MLAKKWNWHGNPQRVFSDLVGLANPYHNCAHASNVVRYVRMIASAALSALSEAEQEDLDIGALYHDAGHSGFTVRQQSPRHVPRKDLGNEEYAVLLMRQDVALPKERLERIEGLIMATTFGRTPHPHPAKTTLEKFIVLADVCGFVEGLDDWMKESLLVLSEADPKQFPVDFAAYRQNRLNFLAYVRTRVDEVLPLVTKAFGRKLQEALDEIVRQIETDAFERYAEAFDLARNAMVR